MDKMVTINIGKEGSLQGDESGNFKRIVYRGKVIELPLDFTCYRLNGMPADVDRTEGESDLSLQLSSEESSARIDFRGGEELTISPNEPLKSWAVTLSFPIETEFHLPELSNVGRTLDSDMPVDDFYAAKLTYNFLLARIEDTWIRFILKGRALSGLEINLSRHPELFLVTLTCQGNDAAAGLKLFPSMEAALEDYEGWLEREIGITKLKEQSRLPDWIHNVKLVFTVDMMRSYGEVSHDYGDVVRLAEELEKTGCPEGTLFYLPGWGGPYDTTHPTYLPHPALGGDDGFRAMVDALHGKGFRVMIHTLGWGIDPYHPDIDRLLQYVAKDSEGRYAGYKIREGGWPPNRPIPFRTDRIASAISSTSPKVSIETTLVPCLCEATVTLGGLGGTEKIRATIGGRSQVAPAGWFSENEAYEFPFPFKLDPGKNRMELEAIGCEEYDWSGCWYRVSRCFVPIHLFRSSTCPILRADTANPGWIKLFVNAVSTVVREYAIDAVHVDATVFDDPSGAKAMLLALREELPDIALCGEWCNTLADVGFWTFCQGARQSLIAQSEKLREPGGQGSLPVRRGLDERYAWLNKSSPVCSFVKKYMYIYPHLCAANGFVPLGKVCNVYPKRLLYEDREELWEILQNSGRLDYIPSLRVNFREYGLDEYTARFVKGTAT